MLKNKTDKLVVKHFLVPVLLISIAIISIFSVEIVVRLQVILGDFSEMAAQTTNSSLMRGLERLKAASSLSSQVANGLSMISLVGAIVFAVIGESSKVLRFTTLAIIISLIVRAYFWETV